MDNSPTNMRTALFLLLTVTAMAGDWPQFLGPQRDCKAAAAGEALAEKMPDGGWTIAWQVECGAGFAGPVVSGGKVVLFHRLKGRETVQAWDAATLATLGRDHAPDEGRAAYAVAMAKSD